MATKEELLIRKKELATKIASLSKTDLVTRGPRFRAELASIERQLLTAQSAPSPRPTTPETSSTGSDSGTPVNQNQDTPALPKDFTFQDFADALESGKFGSGGGLTTTVYLGSTSKSQYFLGKPITTQTAATGNVTKVTNDFWEDKSLQNKIIGAYASKGKNISPVQAFGVWSDLVSMAGGIYQGGVGPKVTPLQLLSDSLKGIKGSDEPSLPTRAISTLDKARTLDAIEEWGLNLIGKKLDSTQKTQLFDLLNKANTGTVTTYNKVKNAKTGKMENVQTTTPGLTQERSQDIVENKIKTDNPAEYERQKAFGFSNELNKIMQGGL